MIYQAFQVIIKLSDKLGDGVLFMSEINEKNDDLLGVKVKTSTKKTINELIEKAKQVGMIEYNGDIFDLLVKSFQQDELSKKMAYGSDLKELQQITRRVNEIFINLAERNETNLEALQRDHEDFVSELNEDLSELKEKNKELKILLTEKESNIKGLTEDLMVNQSKYEELELQQNGYLERIAEQKTIIEEKDEKIVTKNEIISEKEIAISEMKEDIARNKELKESIVTLQATVKELKQSLSDKEQEMIAQKEQLEFEAEKSLFAREKELDKERMEEIRGVQERLTTEITGFQEKYEGIYKEREKLSNANYELQLTMDRLQSDNENKDKEIERLKNYISELEEKNKQD